MVPFLSKIVPEELIHMSLKTVIAQIRWKDFFNIKSLFFIALGNLIYALGVVMFILPNGLITGGTTGLGLFMYHQFGVPVSTFVAIFNVVMFVLGFVFLGASFAMSTLVSTFIYPAFLAVFQNIPQLSSMTDDPLLAVIMAGLMIGFGLGLVVKVGASTGGMDIPPLILNKKFGLSVSVGLYFFDFAILLTQMMFTNRENVIYGILLVLIYTVVLDKVLLMGEKQMQVKIISEQYQAINEAILTQLNRGSTLLKAETGYHKKDGFVVMSIVSKRELNRLRQIVGEIDPVAFMIVNQVNEVRGRGFSLAKKYE